MVKVDVAYKFMKATGYAAFSKTSIFNEKSIENYIHLVNNWKQDIKTSMFLVSKLDEAGVS